MKSVCVYCGSSDKTNSGYIEAAREMGRLLAKHSLELIYGAGSTGLMGALADGVLQAGGEVTGVIPGYFNTPQLAHSGLTRLEIVDTIHQRKARMAELADAFIALPGGYGTFEEFFEILTWAPIGLHSKPIGLLNANHYFDPLLALVEHAGAEGFIYEEHCALFTYDEQPGALLLKMKHHRNPDGLERWLNRDE